MDILHLMYINGKPDSQLLGVCVRNRFLKQHDSSHHIISHNGKLQSKVVMHQVHKDGHLETSQSRFHQMSFNLNRLNGCKAPFALLCASLLFYTPLQPIHPSDKHAQTIMCTGTHTNTNSTTHFSLTVCMRRGMLSMQLLYGLG